MGQKVHPYGFRLGYTKPWKSRWFVERDYDKLLLEDVRLKNELKDKLKGDVQKRTGREVYIDIQEVHKPELDAQLVSESIALQLEKRVGFRRAMRKAVDSALRFGCKGIKVRVSGRLNGNEIARSEWYLQGRLPLHTLRADIEYGFSEAKTTYGVIGVKCWIYRGEILPQKKREVQQPVGAF
ncbi:MAG: 30S ribosomal protein S3 [Acidobacteria bacterium]|nr:MAG: 30S ribosomal protein S3 [Acidobacteriota bacterium]